ncbi:transposase [Streptomyces triticirhizae]|nr:transposase [Streptomyces triticirhizae]
MRWCRERLVRWRTEESWDQVAARPVHAINPLAAARYRDRHSVSRGKSDPGDALVLANILRTDIHARALAEIGDDPDRFTDARALKAYAGSAPVTRASGKKKFVGRRYIKNNRLINAGFLWAFSALKASPKADAHHRRRRRQAGDWHAQAQRHLFNRFLGQLYHCPHTRQLFDEQHAFTSSSPDLAVAA